MVVNMKYVILVFSLSIFIAGVFIEIRKIKYNSEISKISRKKKISVTAFLDRAISSAIVKRLVNKRYILWIYLPIVRSSSFEEKVRLFTEKMLFTSICSVSLLILPIRGVALLPSIIIGFIPAFYFPDLNYFISRRKRMLASERELSLTVDMLAGMCDSGISVRKGLELSAKVLRSDLKDDIKLFCSGTVTGKGKELILEDLRKKSPALSVINFFEMLTRFEELGSPVNSYLSELSIRLREDRIFRAEENARRSQILSLFPLTFLILPSFLIMTVTIFFIPSIGLLNG